MIAPKTRTTISVARVAGDVSPVENYGYGGRRAIVDKDGRLWVVWQENNGTNSWPIKTARTVEAYGPDVAWEVFDVATVTRQVQGFAFALWTDGYPVFVEKRIGATGFALYRWNNGSQTWSNPSTTASASNDIESFDVVTCGTKLWLFYIERSAGSNFLNRRSSTALTSWTGATNLATETDAHDDSKARRVACSTDYAGNSFAMVAMRTSANSGNPVISYAYMAPGGLTWSVLATLRAFTEPVSTPKHLSIGVECRKDFDLGTTVQLHHLAWVGSAFMSEPSEGVRINTATSLSAWPVEHRVTPFNVDGSTEWPAYLVTTDGVHHIAFRCANLFPDEDGARTSRPMLGISELHASIAASSEVWPHEVLEYVEGSTISPPSTIAASHQSHQQTIVRGRAFFRASGTGIQSSHSNPTVQWKIRVAKSTIGFGGTSTQEKGGKLLAASNKFRLTGRANKTADWACSAFSLMLWKQLVKWNARARNTLGLKGAARKTTILVRSAHSTLGLEQAAMRWNPLDFETTYTPSPPIPSDPTKYGYTLLSGPFELPTRLVQLPAPMIGDTRTADLGIVVNRTRGGQARTFKHADEYRRLGLRFRGISRKKELQLQEFFAAMLGRTLRYQDHEGRVWNVWLVNSEVPFVIQRDDYDSLLTMEFEGRTVGTVEV